MNQIHGSLRRYRCWCIGLRNVLQTRSKSDRSSDLIKKEKKYKGKGRDGEECVHEMKCLTEGVNKEEGQDEEVETSEDSDEHDDEESDDEDREMDEIMARVRNMMANSKYRLR